MEKFLGVSEFAKELAFSESRIRQLLRNRTIQGGKVGKRWRIPKAELARLKGHQDTVAAVDLRSVVYNHGTPLEVRNDGVSAPGQRDGHKADASAIAETRGQVPFLDEILFRGATGPLPSRPKGRRALAVRVVLSEPHASIAVTCVTEDDPSLDYVELVESVATSNIIQLVDRLSSLLQEFEIAEVVTTDEIQNELDEEFRRTTMSENARYGKHPWSGPMVQDLPNLSKAGRYDSFKILLGKGSLRLSEGCGLQVAMFDAPTSGAADAAVLAVTASRTDGPLLAALAENVEWTNLSLPSLYEYQSLKFI